MYNFDEKKFMIKVDINSEQVMNLKEMGSGEIIKATQDGKKK